MSKTSSVFKKAVTTNSNLLPTFLWLSHLPFQIVVYSSPPQFLTNLFSLVLFFFYFHRLLFPSIASVLFRLRLLSRRSTLPASAMKSSRYLPSPWIRTRPSPCPMWCPISGSCRTPAPPTAWWCPGTPWSKGTTPRSPPLSSTPPHRDWST